ncbi:hypothetical protein ACFE04_029454 [Oxalis oulophora]
MEEVLNVCKGNAHLGATSLPRGGNQSKSPEAPTTTQDLDCQGVALGSSFLIYFMAFSCTSHMVFEGFLANEALRHLVMAFVNRVDIECCMGMEGGNVRIDVSYVTLLDVKALLAFVRMVRGVNLYILREGVDEAGIERHVRKAQWVQRVMMKIFTNVIVSFN